LARRLFAGSRFYGGADLLFHCFQVEACRALHWRKLDETLADLGHNLLREDDLDLK